MGKLKLKGYCDLPKITLPAVGFTKINPGLSDSNTCIVNYGSAFLVVEGMWYFGICISVLYLRQNEKQGIFTSLKSTVFRRDFSGESSTG